MSGVPAVDHFVPWSRWPNDAVQNLVLSHPSCNSRKSDHVPGPIPLGRWCDRLSSQGPELDAIAVTCRWRTDRPRTISLARSLYAHLPTGAVVWNGPQDVVGAIPGELMAILSSL